MGRLARLILPRVSVLSGLVVLVLVIQGIALFRPPRWRSPAVAATPDGLLLAWLEGTRGSVPVSVQAFDGDLEPRGPARRFGRAPASAKIAFWTDGDPRRFVLVPDRLGVIEGPLGAFDWLGRREDPPAWRGSRWPAWSPAGDDQGWRPSSGGWVTDSDRATASTVLDAEGGLRAILERQHGGWAVWPTGPHHARATRLEEAHCPPLAMYGCVAAAAVGKDLVVAWTRSRSLGSELVLSRIAPDGGIRSAVLARDQSGTLVIALSALLALVVALVGHALRKAVTAGRVLLSLRVGAEGGVWLDGRLDEPRPDLVRDAGASPWRMRTAAAWLNVPSGDRVLLQTGTPFVVTLAALRGELPVRAAAVASFERAYAAGILTSPDEAGAYRGGSAGALRLKLLADAPLTLVRSTLRATIAWACLDAVSLLAVGLVATLLAL